MNADTARALEYAFKVAGVFFFSFYRLFRVLFFYAVEPHNAKEREYRKWKREKKWQQITKD